MTLEKRGEFNLILVKQIINLDYNQSFLKPDHETVYECFCQDGDHIPAVLLLNHNIVTKKPRP